MDLRKYAKSPASFRADLMIECDGSVKRFGDVCNDWQAQDFAAIDPAMKLIAGRSTEPAKLRAYLERPRGHSKTSDLAMMIAWCLTFANRPIRGHCYAADKDQARLLRDAVATLIRVNPWLSEVLVVESNRVITVSGPAKDSTLAIEASDVASSYGILSDLLICDEITHWPEAAGEQLWQSLISTAGKKTTLLVCIANAGFTDGFAWNVREAARTDEAWLFSRLDGPQASWITPQRLAEQRRMLPAVAFNRLWMNQWSSGGGDALPEADVLAAFDRTLEPMTGTRDELLKFDFVCGVDLAISRDNAAVVVVAVPKGGKAGRIRLASHRIFRPHGAKLNLIDVEHHILRLEDQFGLENVICDQYQAELLCSRLEADSTHLRRNSFRTRHMARYC